MVKINGVKAKLTNEEILKNNSSPSMNQILEKMENNFHDIESRAQTANSFQNLQNENTSNTVNTMSTSQNENGSIFGDSNILLSLLPLLAGGKDKANIFGSNSPILKEIIKKSNNPMLQKILELLPVLTKPKASKQNKEKVEEKKETKIDSYVKTDDYNVT